jgi:uncharacterized membrane protein YedE/YeeE
MSLIQRSTTTTTTPTTNNNKTENNTNNNKPPTWNSVLVKMVTSLIMGILFGYVMDQAMVSSPTSIRRQFIFNKFIMLKMFLTAAGVGAVVFSFMEYFMSEKFHQVRCSRGYSDKGLLTLLIGGILQGIGMALSGACPGTVVIQMSHMDTISPFLIYVGGLFGAICYGGLHPVLNKWHLLDFEHTLKPSFDDAHIDRIFKKPFFILGLPLAIMLFSVVAIIEYFVPYQQEIRGDVIKTHKTDEFPPELAGLVVGLLQIPAFIELSTFLGASSAYSVITSQYQRVASEHHRSRFTYIGSFLKSPAWWQVAYGAGAFAGGMLSVHKNIISKHQLAGNSLSVSHFHAFLGGVLLVFGARVAGGCASGHGLSGFPLLNIGGWITVPAMFGGAILTMIGMTIIYGEEILL